MLNLIKLLVILKKYSFNGWGDIITIIDSITDTLVTGENVELRGLGSFTVRHYDSYTGMNPKTGEKVVVKVKKAPFFKVGKELKEAVNGEGKHK